MAELDSLSGPRDVRRRTLLTAAAWSAPVVAVAVAAPAQAASAPACTAPYSGIYPNPGVLPPASKYVRVGDIISHYVVYTATAEWDLSEIKFLIGMGEAPIDRSTVNATWFEHVGTPTLSYTSANGVVYTLVPGTVNNADRYSFFEWEVMSTTGKFEVGDKFQLNYTMQAHKTGPGASSNQGIGLYPVVASIVCGARTANGFATNVNYGVNP